MSEPYILILYYSRNGATEKLANLIARGVESANDIEARIRTVPAVSTLCEATQNRVPEQGPPFVSKEDFANCSGIILGSPTRFGNMAAPLKYFLDTTGAEWNSGSLINKPAGVFTSTSTIHGGQESTLLSMMLPLIHHGCVIVGVPYSESALNQTKSGGTPYGPSHHSGLKHEKDITEDEKKICLSFGKRLAEIAIKLSAIAT
jgi:NAD(P)H dehydrogenase (quinone)